MPPTPKHRKKDPVSIARPKPHRMTAMEYFAFMSVRQLKGERAAMLATLRKPDVWATFHWLVPYGTGFRAHSIVGTVKSVTRDNVDLWVKSRPEAAETKIHGISQGDIVSVPLECITGVSEPMEDLYPEGDFPNEF
jgi:hypothetical protein